MWTVVAGFNQQFTAITSWNGSAQSNRLHSFASCWHFEPSAGPQTFRRIFVDFSQVRTHSLQELVYKQGQASHGWHALLFRRGDVDSGWEGGEETEEVEGKLSELTCSCKCDGS
mmetsp:Transcript_11232/g.26161  ORF Transcript_11232/g.26161 Transcript_11232/m.26161 type:complete len:114 (+) Transcript_11232:328-669(+)